MTNSEPTMILAMILANYEGTLPGCENDGTMLAACLPDFAVRRCSGATRPEIFALFRQLLRELREDTVLVVFLSGHGGQARFSAGLGPGLPPELVWPFFVTVDQVRGGTFNSVLAVELSMLVGRCAEITRNVVVIVDTCFAQDMLRGRTRLKSVGRQVFALPTHLVAEHAEFATFAGWVDTLRSGPRAASLLDDRVVCVSAAGVGLSAHEADDGQGRPGGVFTRELCALLADGRARRVCWRHLVSVLRERLAARWGAWFQRPEVAGPDERRLFELDSVDVSASVGTFRGAEGSWWIRSGRIHGTDVGDVFVAHGVETFTELEVVEVREADARVVCDDRGGNLEAGALALPQRIRRRIPVAVAPDLPGREALIDRLSRSMRVTPCAPDEAPILHVSGHPEGLTIRGEHGRHERVGRVDPMIAGLEALARAHSFEVACSLPLEPWNGVEWSHRVLHSRVGGARELGEMDQVLTGDRLWLELVNNSPYEVPGLYVNVIELGIDGRLEVLNSPQHPAGVRVCAGSKRRVLWYPEGPYGRPQVWPADVPRSEPREVTWYLIASPLPLDLRSVATHALDAHPASGFGGRIGGRRSDAAADLLKARTPSGTPSDIRWICRRTSFMLALA